MMMQLAPKHHPKTDYFHITAWPEVLNPSNIDKVKKNGGCPVYVRPWTSVNYLVSFRPG